MSNRALIYDREQREAEKRKEEKLKKQAIDFENIGKIIAAVESREPNADFYRQVVTWMMESAEPASMLVRRGILTDEQVESQHGWKLVNDECEKLVKKSDGKTLRGIMLEILLWDWSGGVESQISTAAKAYKVKLQTSGKAKKGDDQDEDEGI